METSQPIDSRRDDGEDGIMPVHHNTGTPDYEVSTHMYIHVCGHFRLSLSLSFILLFFSFLFISSSVTCTHLVLHVRVCVRVVNAFPHHLSPPVAGRHRVGHAS